MKARSLSGELSSSDKEFIETYYKLLTKKHFIPGKCDQYYRDAFVEIYVFSQKKGLLKTDFKLKNGIVLRLNDTPDIITNKNITNEIAEKWLRQNPERENVFSSVPITHLNKK